MMRYKVTYNDKQYFYEHPISVLELVGNDKNIVCCYVNNKLRELTYIIKDDSTVVALTSKDRDARQIYNASLRFIVSMAMKKLCPDKSIRFLNGISRSLYMEFINREEMDDHLLNYLQQELDDIVAKDMALIRHKVTKKEAQEIFLKEGYIEKAKLIDYRPEDTCHFYTCGDYTNYMHNRMMPSTGYITKFKLIKYSPGIIIQYPRYDYNGEIPPFENNANYGKTLQEATVWSKITGADTVININKKIEQGDGIDFINLSEARHNLQLATIGNKIVANPNIRIIYIAGPSSSGKTTFANRLRIELLSRGLEPLRISLDDYYKERAKIPLDEFGEKDFETIDALRLDDFKIDMENLILGKEVNLPIFSFKEGKVIKYRKIKLNENQPIIVEGIHALNSKTSEGIDKDKIFKIFIAPTAQIALDNENPLSSTDLRLVRRMVRDNKYRSTSALETLKMWPNVRKGEFKWIYKTQENADYIFNSFLPYELCVLKKYALPLLEEIEFDNEYFYAAERLIRMLKFFKVLDEKWIPQNSLIREFIGGSCYQDV